MIINMTKNSLHFTCETLNRKIENREICNISAFDFSNCECKRVFIEVQASIIDRKTAARPFYTIQDIL